MSGTVNFLKKLADAVDKIMYAIGSAGLIVCAGMCGANILMWWLFGRRIAVCDEISLFGLVWTTYIGMGVLFRSGGHCTMDFLVQALPAKARTVLRIITDIAILAISLLTVYYSWKLALKSFTKRLVLTKIPYFFVDASVTCGYTHLIFLVIGDIVSNIHKLIYWNKEAIE